MISYDNNGPIYVQIKSDLEFRIIKGIYKSGVKLPSVRELALEYGVTVVIMQRALTQLQNKELIEVKRGIGNFVTENQNVIDEVKKKIVVEKQKEVKNFLIEVDIELEEFMKGVANDQN